MITDVKILPADTFISTAVAVPSDNISLVYVNSNSINQPGFMYVIKVYVNNSPVITYKTIPNNGNAAIIDITKIISSYCSTSIFPSYFHVNHFSLPISNIKIGVQEYYNNALQGQEVFSTNYPYFKSYFPVNEDYFNVSKINQHLHTANERSWLSFGDSSIRRYYLPDMITFIGAYTGQNIEIINENNDIDIFGLQAGINTLNITEIFSNLTISLTPTMKLKAGGELAEIEFKLLDQCDVRYANLIFLNNFGVGESYIFRYNYSETYNINRQTYRRKNWDYIGGNVYMSGGVTPVHGQVIKRYTLHTGYISEQEYQYLFKTLFYAQNTFIQFPYTEPKPCYIDMDTFAVKRYEFEELLDISVDVLLSINDNKLLL